MKEITLKFFVSKDTKKLLTFEDLENIKSFIEFTVWKKKSKLKESDVCLTVDI